MDGKAPVRDRSTQAAQIAPEADDVWQQTLDDLVLQMARATFDKLLLGSRAMAWNAESNAWTIEVRNRYAPGWLSRRMANVVQRALARRLPRPGPDGAADPVPPQIEYVAAESHRFPVPSSLRGPASQENRRKPPSHDALHERAESSAERRPPRSPANGGSGSRSLPGSARPSIADPAAAQIEPGVTRRSAGTRPGAKLGPNDYYIRIKTAFREEALLRLQGPKLSVFMCLALHADNDRTSAPGLDRIERETGFCRTTIIRALREMSSPALPMLERLPPTAWRTSRYRILGYAYYGSTPAPALFEEESWKLQGNRDRETDES
jgi:hypothetical protein